MGRLVGWIGLGWIGFGLPPPILQPILDFVCSVHLYHDHFARVFHVVYSAVSQLLFDNNNASKPGSSDQQLSVPWKRPCLYKTTMAQSVVLSQPWVDKWYKWIIPLIHLLSPAARSTCHSVRLSVCRQHRHLMPNTHRWRRRDSTQLSSWVELSCVGGVYAPVGCRDPVYNSAAYMWLAHKLETGSRLTTGAFTPPTRRNSILSTPNCSDSSRLVETVANYSCEFNTHRRRNSTRQLSCVGVGGVYWA